MYWNKTVRGGLPCSEPWLIETWDVLKSAHKASKEAAKTWLIETWDVLKCTIDNKEVHGIIGLIETWDVLKFEKY